MSKLLYFDCPSGISGDMTLGALVDLGVPFDLLVAELDKLGLLGFNLTRRRVSKNGISAEKIDVNIEHCEGHAHDHDEEHGHAHDHDHSHATDHTHAHDRDHSHGEHHHRTYSDIVKIIDSSGISERAKNLAKAIFRRIALSEGKVHNKSPEDVHFHEVGALDSIVDIVGTAICIDILSPDEILCSVVNDGHGFTHCQHGMIPIPVPAVTEIFANSSLELRQTDIEKELVTPTGAAILAELSGRSSIMPQMTIEKIGYGAGNRDLKIPNVLRIFLGELAESKQHSDTITVLETNIDDCAPDILGYAMERLFDAGAKDVFFTSIQMKKNRPAVKLTVLCETDDVQKLEGIIFAETTTIGIRRRTEDRTCLDREFGVIKTPNGDIRTKSTTLNGVKRTTLEYEDAKSVAEKSGQPLNKVKNQGVEA